MFAPLPRSFYQPSAAEVAPALLGHWLIRRTAEGCCGGIIVETEAYLVEDPASHGFGGLTARNRAMFGPPGHAYVYLIYGLHYCVNAVCQPAGRAEAVLIRALAPIFGTALMRSRRGPAPANRLTSGPARICQALAIDRELDGVDVCAPDSPLLIAQNPERQAVVAKQGPVQVTPRIGISKAADRPLRFVLAGSPHLSRAIRHG
ncbi:MAG TPA: DNA-3-methyladenine glycosylase [Methylomirabilota bacterium]|nr:DNA-3-methyladenine glycosylase [Methylomirabilota bacterium]